MIQNEALAIELYLGIHRLNWSGMVELTPEERHSLNELVDEASRGNDVKEFISNRLYDELSYVTGHDSFGNERRVFKDGFEDQYQIYIGLYEKGLLNAYPPNEIHGGYWFEGLTSAGRGYFDAEDFARKAEEVGNTCELYSVTDSKNTHSWYTAGMFLETREENKGLDKFFSWIEEL